MTTTVVGLSADHPSHTWSTHRDVPRHSPPAFPGPLATDEPTDPLDGIDPEFVFDFRAYDDPDDTDQRWSTWLSVEPLCRGPEPRPDWLVTSQAAVDTELGILKTGKEADVFLLERAVPDDGPASVVMAAKRYRGEEHRTFHRSAAYTEGRRDPKQPATPARSAKKTAHGRAVAAGQWALAEWEALKRLWSLGLPVPYPVQIDGTEMLMEWITHDGETAPRLAQTRPEPDLLAVVLRPAARRPGRAGPARDRPRRPVGVQHPGRGRAPGHHRPAAGGRPGRQPGRAWTS